MSAKLFFLTGLLGIGGYLGYKVTSYDPTVVPYSKAQVQSMLASGRLEVPNALGNDSRVFYGTGKTGPGVGLAFTYSKRPNAPVISCQAVITELAPNQSRVVARCGTRGTSAMANTMDEMHEAIVDEYIQSKLHNRAFDAKRAESKVVGATMRNMGGMQKEALKTADEMSKMSSSSSSWDSGSSSSSSSSQSSGGWGADTPSGSH